MGDAWRRVGRDAFAVESRAIEWRLAVIGALVSAGPLAVGAAAGRVDAGLYAGLGGLNVGLAVSGSSLRRRAVRGATTLGGAVAATVLATTLHPSALLSVVATAVIVTVLALTAAGDRQDALVGFVVSAVFVIVNGLAGDASDALARALQFGAGGAVAFGLFLLVASDVAEPDDRSSIGSVVARTARSAGHPVRRHAARVGVATSIGTALYRALGLAFGYWIPLTTLAVLQPDGHASRVRAVQRTTGTLVGTAAVAAVAAATDSRAVLIALVAGCAFGLFALRGRSYHWLVALLTPTALLMIATRTGASDQLVTDRLANTAIGVAVAVAAATIAVGTRPTR